MIRPSGFSLKCVLGLVGVSHIVIGGIGCIPGISIVKLAAIFYKASVTLNPQLEHIIQMFGIYMLIVGILAIFALRDPVRNKPIIYGIIILLLLRVLQRIAFASQVYTVFSIPSGWYWTQTIFFLAIAIALILLCPKSENTT